MSSSWHAYLDATGFMPGSLVLDKAGSTHALAKVEWPKAMVVHSPWPSINIPPALQGMPAPVKHRASSSRSRPLCKVDVFIAVGQP